MYPSLQAKMSGRDLDVIADCISYLRDRVGTSGLEPETVQYLPSEEGPRAHFTSSAIANEA